MIPFYKFLFDVSFLYTFLNVFSIALESNASTVKSMVLILVEYCAYQLLHFVLRKGKMGIQKALKVAVVVAFVCGFHFLAGSLDKMCYFFAGIFLLMVVFSEREDDDYKGSRKTYFFATGAVIIPVLAFISVSLDAGKTMSEIMDNAIPFFLTMQISAFFLLRGTRERSHAKGNSEYRKYRLREEFSLGILLFLSWSSKLYNSCRSYVEMFYYEILQPILFDIGNFFGYLLYHFFYFFGQFIHATPEQLEEMRKNYEKQQKLKTKQISIPDSDAVTQTQSHFVQQFLMTALVVIILITVAVLILRLLGHKSAEEKESHVEEYREKLSRQENITHHLGSLTVPSDPALALRYYYRKYLTYLKRHKIPLTPAMTSEEVCQEALSSTKAESFDSCQIQQLYVTKRYQDPSQTTKKDLQHMKALVHHSS